MTALTDQIEIGAEAPTTLYRCFAKDGSLLYVGITGNITARMKAHAKRAAWWRRCCRRTVTLYATRAAAEDAEDAAILTEHPLHNRIGRVPVPAAAPRLRLTAAERQRQHEEVDAIAERARTAVNSWFPALLEQRAKAAGMPLEEYLAARRAAITGAAS